MNLVSRREIRMPKYTISRLFIEGEYLCDVLEDVDRGLNDNMSEEEIKSKKVYGETAIPYGTYEIDMNTVSNKFKDRNWAIPYDGKLPRLKNVKGFEGVLIHVGNSNRDTLGCLLVGSYYPEWGIVINSKTAFNKLMSILQDHKDEKITIKIE